MKPFIALLAAAIPVTCALACPPVSEPGPDPVPTRCQPPAPPVISAEEHHQVSKTLREAIADAIMRDAKGAEKESGKKVISDGLGTELATVPGFTRVRRGPQGGRTWIDARDAAAHPEMLMYRIRWFNGNWSKWHIPGVNDRDWKDPTGRVWRYFTDHEHELITIDRGGPLATRQAYIGFNP